MAIGKVHATCTCTVHRYASKAMQSNLLKHTALHEGLHTRPSVRTHSNWAGLHAKPSVRTHRNWAGLHAKPSVRTHSNWAGLHAKPSVSETSPGIREYPLQMPPPHLLPM